MGNASLLIGERVRGGCLLGNIFLHGAVNWDHVKLEPLHSLAENRDTNSPEGGNEERGKSLPQTRMRSTVAERTARFIEDLGPALPLLLPSENVNRMLGRPPRGIHPNFMNRIPFLRSRKRGNEVSHTW
jgi:hypothetical protein